MRQNMPADNLSFLQRLAEYGLLGYAWLIVISIWGGTVRYITDVKRGNKPSFVTWLYEAIISAFVGMITAMLCQYYQMDFFLAGAITGICAHNGTRSLYIIGQLLKKNNPALSQIVSEQQVNARLSKKKEKDNGTND